MKVKGTRFTPRNLTVTYRIRPSSDENIKKFCDEYGFFQSEAADIIFQWLGKNGKKIAKELKEIKKRDYPCQQES